MLGLDTPYDNALCDALLRMAKTCTEALPFQLDPRKQEGITAALSAFIFRTFLCFQPLRVGSKSSRTRWERGFLT